MRVRVRPLFFVKSAVRNRYGMQKYVAAAGESIALPLLHCVNVASTITRGMLVFLLKRLFCVLNLFQAAGRGFMPRRNSER